MNDLVVIQGRKLEVKEYRGKRVVTFKDIDTVHQRPDGTARKRFNDNRQHFVSGVDFFKITQPSEIRTLGIERPQGGTPKEVYLITETGYLMLVKSFTDDLAWKVQRELVDSYFRVKETVLEDCEAGQQETGTNVIDTDKLIRCSEIMAGCLDGNRPYVLNILRNIIPNIDGNVVDAEKEDVHDVSVKTATNTKLTSAGMRSGYSIPFDCKKLDSYLYDNMISSSRLEEMIRCSSGCVNKWRLGKQAPGTYYRNLICGELNLPEGYFNKHMRRRRD